MENLDASPARYLRPAMGIALKDGKDPVTGEPTTSWEVKR